MRELLHEDDVGGDVLGHHGRLVNDDERAHAFEDGRAALVGVEQRLLRNLPPPPLPAGGSRGPSARTEAAVHGSSYVAAKAADLPENGA